MSAEEWIEDENHRTINGERWVARKCDGGCSGNGFPACEWKKSCSFCEHTRNVRWYRADSRALTSFDGLTEKAARTVDPNDSAWGIPYIDRKKYRRAIVPAELSKAEVYCGHGKWVPWKEIYPAININGLYMRVKIEDSEEIRAQGNNPYLPPNSNFLADKLGVMEEEFPKSDPPSTYSNCMDAIQASLKTLLQDRDRKAVKALRDSLAASLDARVQAAMDAMLAPYSDAKPAPTPAPAPEPAPAQAPEDDVEIIIDPMPEQVPEDGVWGCCWNNECDDFSVEKLIPDDLRPIWNHYAILVRGHLGPKELPARVRKMLAEKEGK